MNAWTFILVAVLAAAVSSDSSPTKPTPTTTTPKPTTTTPKPTTTTPKPTTTTPAPTTTTLAPTTTTPKPTPKKNTTLAPTKHNTTLAPTTLAPTKPPTAVPTTKPVPVPEYSVMTKDKKPCITLKADIAVNYKNTSSKLPAKGVEVAGDCLTNLTTGFISLSWKSAQTNGVVVATSFKMDFAEAKEQWMATNMSYSLTIGKEAPLKGYIQKDQNLKSFQASLKKSYKCDRSEIVNMEHGVIINIQHLQVQPLPLIDGTKFLNDTMCPATPDVTPTSSIVPIAVGCALAGLIVIVLIAYLVGRRKSSRGYQQV